jgi:class 3 adenylate cyclase/tetratricopeptide (TPR) repeat protein
MTEREQLEQAIAALEAQRDSLGDAVVDAALGPMRLQLAELERTEHKPAPGFEVERKLVTVMFADISGYTALTEKLDPEAVRDLVNACFDHLVPIIEKYDGKVVRFIGDEIMATFGAPVVHENDPERALRTALEMMDELATFNANYNIDMGIHIGINTGLVIAGGIGSEGQQQYGVTGDAVNLAARLRDASERGEIYVGPDTHRLVAPLFRFERLEPMQVKGKSEPVQVYRLMRVKAQPGRVRGLEMRGIYSPLVGRDTQLATINERIQRLLEGQGGILMIIGEAGAGKSRLMAEARQRANNFTGQWLEGRTLSFGQTISYWPFQEILWAFADITDEDSEAGAWDKLEASLNNLFDEDTLQVLPYLASLLSLEVRGEYAERVKFLDGEAMGRQVFIVMRRFVERLARVKPLVLVFEDLHWMDASSAALVEHLLPLVERVPLLICGLSRPKRDSPSVRLQTVAHQDYASRYNEIVLDPLSDVDSVQLVANLLAIDDLPDSLRAMIVDKAEGNPFFLEEIIRSLIDSGAVVRDPVTRRWRATDQARMVTIPDTVQGVIMARIDRLDEEVKAVLQKASVVGRSFIYRVLHALQQVENRLDDHLAELLEMELIREKQRTPELEYIFKHALAQEATYESILMARRRELHARVAATIETLFAGRLEEFYGLLAYHYARAEIWDKAQSYLMKAGDQAGRVAADGEALAHYRQAMEAYERAFGETWEPLEHAELERKISEALYRQGDHAQAMEHAQRGLEILCGWSIPGSTWGIRLGILGQSLLQIGHQLLPGVFLGKGVDADRAAAEEELRLYEPIFWIEQPKASMLLILMVLRALNHSERHNLPYGCIGGYATVGFVLDYLNLFSLANIYYRRAWALAEDFGHPDIQARVHHALAGHYLQMGKPEEEIDYLQRSSGLYKEIGDLHNLGLTLDALAMVLCYQGKLSKALDIVHELAPIGEEGNIRLVQCLSGASMGNTLMHMGRYGEVEPYLKESLRLAESIPSPANMIFNGGLLGRCYLYQGKFTTALETLHATQKTYQEFNARRRWRFPFVNSLAETYLFAAENPEIAPGHSRSEWLKLARDACRDAMKVGRGCRMGLPEAMRLQGTCEWLRGRRGAAERWWHQGLSFAVRNGIGFDEAMIHLEMGCRLDEREHLEKAAALFEEMGSEYNLGLARGALEASGNAL